MRHPFDKLRINLSGMTAKRKGELAAMFIDVIAYEGLKKFCFLLLTFGSFAHPAFLDMDF